MARKKTLNSRKTFDELVRVLMEGASGFDNVGFVTASMTYLGHKLKKDPMEAFVETIWDLYFDKGTASTAKVRIMEMLSRCVAKIPDGRMLEQNLPNLSDEQLGAARAKVLDEVARRIGLPESEDGSEEEPSSPER
jgi:hypothetical protein